MIELHGVSKTVPSGTRHAHDPPSARSRVSRRGRVVAITGPSGSGKSTLLGLHRRPRRAVDRAHRHRRRRHHGARRRRARAAARQAHRLRVPVLSPAAVADRARERPRADGDCRRARTPAARADALLDGGRPRRARPSLSVAALGRRAAARRDRARARQRSADPARRRADRKPRQRDRPPGHRSAARRQPSARDDARARHARSGAGRVADVDRAARRPRRRATRSSRSTLGRSDERSSSGWRLRETARVVAPAAVLLRLRRDRRRRDRRAALDHPERPQRR